MDKVPVILVSKSLSKENVSTDVPHATSTFVLVATQTEACERKHHATVPFVDSHYFSCGWTHFN